MTNWATHFSTCFEDRFQHCWMLLELSRQQHQWIETDNYDRLMTVLSQKQAILEQLDYSRKQHPRLMDDWQQQRDTLSSSVREQCRTLLEQTEQCLQELNQLEAESTQRLQSKVNLTRRELESLSHGQHIHQAYRSSTPTRTSRLLDIGQ